MWSIFFAFFVVVMLPRLLVCNYKMLNCSTEFGVPQSFFAFEDNLYRAVHLAYHHIERVGVSFAGFDCLDFYVRWIQDVVDLFCIVCCCYVASFVGVQLQDVELFDRVWCSSEFLCI